MQKAIDLHCHYNHGAMDETIENELYNPTLPFLQKERERLNVIATCMSSFAGVMTAKHVEEENEHCRKICKEQNWLYQWVVVDPRQPNNYKQAEQILKDEKCLGIKIHCGCHGYKFVDYADELFAFANEKKTFILMHNDDTEKTVPFADKYPDMKLIIAHLGTIEHINAISWAKHGNIFTDTSGGASNKNNVVEYAVEKIGADKIFFGTDTYSCAFQRGRIDYADISEEDKRKILFENAKKHFKQFKNL